MCDRAGNDESVGRVAVQPFEGDREQRDIAGEGNFSDTGIEQLRAQIFRRRRCLQSTFGDQHGDFPETDGRNRELVFGERLLCQGTTAFPEGEIVGGKPYCRVGVEQHCHLKAFQ